MDAVFFLTIYDDWGRQKKEYFKELDLDIHVLREVTPAEKGLNASDIRKLMADNRPWEHLVPPACADLLNQWNIPERLTVLLGQ